MAKPVGDVLAALARYDVGSITVVDALTRVCLLAREAVEPAAFVGVTTIIDGRAGTHMCSDDEMAEMDRVQYASGEGPCVEAYRTGQPVLLRTMTGEGPFPAFRATVLDHGVRSTASLPMVASQRVVGALNFYGTQDDAFGPDDLELSYTFAEHAAYTLANTLAYWDARALADNLSKAMESRAVIEQAKGIIMAATGVDADEAFEQLKRQSQHENVKLRDVATEIVARTRRRRD